MTETLTIRMPAALARELKAKAKLAKTNPSEILRQAASDYVRNTKRGISPMQNHILARAGTWDGGDIGSGTAAEDASVILVDTSVIVAWLDKNHPQHELCKRAIYDAARDTLAVSSVTYAELAAGGRTREGMDEDLEGFERLELDFAEAWRAGQAFRQYRRKATDDPVLPDFLIRAQAAVRNLPHLTNDRRRTGSFPDVDFKFATDHGKKDE